VDHPALITPAPEQSRSTSETQPPAIPLERHIGKIVALAASAIAAGVTDYTNCGAMTVATKIRVGDQFWELYRLRCLMVGIGAWDFDAICHEQGRRALAESCGGVNAAEERILDELVNGVMKILRGLVRLQAN